MGFVQQVPGAFHGMDRRQPQTVKARGKLILDQIKRLLVGGADRDQVLVGVPEQVPGGRRGQCAAEQGGLQVLAQFALGLDRHLLEHGPGRQPFLAFLAQAVLEYGRWHAAGVASKTEGQIVIELELADMLELEAVGVVKADPAGRFALGARVDGLEAVEIEFFEHPFGERSLGLHALDLVLVDADGVGQESHSFSSNWH
ncbi:MAG: hypothetical protein BWY87_01622 [Deltaproteobacteria bacterium ADurb.Bin510]|nr:MAG: hypothetical protein BWY87_01622 [Deltaproteobacteria bacterium ADurb.Bin510]